MRLCPGPAPQHRGIPAGQAGGPGSAFRGVPAPEWKRRSGLGAPGKAVCSKPSRLSASVPHREYALGRKHHGQVQSNGPAPRTGRSPPYWQRWPAKPVSRSDSRASSLTQALTDHGYRPEVRGDGYRRAPGLPVPPALGAATEHRVRHEPRTAHGRGRGAEAPYRACFDPPRTSTTAACGWIPATASRAKLRRILPSPACTDVPLSATGPAARLASIRQGLRVPHGRPFVLDRGTTMSIDEQANR